MHGERARCSDHSRLGCQTVAAVKGDNQEQQLSVQVLMLSFRCVLQLVQLSLAMTSNKACCSIPAINAASPTAAM